MSKENNILLEQDEDVSSNSEDIDMSLEEYLSLEAKSSEEIIDKLNLVNDFLAEHKDKEEEKELKAEQEIELREQKLIEYSSSNEEILVSIDNSLKEANSYMYTLNVYMSGFFVILILYIITKMLIGFFKPFI